MAHDSDALRDTISRRQGEAEGVSALLFRPVEELISAGSIVAVQGKVQP